MSEKVFASMDGNQAAAWCAYAFTEVAGSDGVPLLRHRLHRHGNPHHRLAAGVSALGQGVGYCMRTTNTHNLDQFLLVRFGR